MSETPRLRSAFPTTPRTDRSDPRLRSNVRQSYPPSSRPSSARPSSLTVTKPSQSATAQNHDAAPLISLDVLDAPTQRFYAAACYAGLMAWRTYNSIYINDDLDSTWLFLKWVGIDAAFFVALPAFRIPWLQFSFIATLTLWLLHFVLNLFLMYKIPIPIFAWIGAFFKVFYDRELSISEHRVKPANILHNSSIILGKQIIQILPEGSALFNAEKYSYCLGAGTPSVNLPIRINQTTPISIELLRYDLETAEEETITLSARQIRQLKSKADKAHGKKDTNTPRTLNYTVSRTGIYRLQRVIDQSKLEVRRRNFDAVVVSCPRASVSAAEKDRCLGDISSISLHASGVAPLKVRYSKKVNRQQASLITQTIQASEESSESQVVLDPRIPQFAAAQSKDLSVDIAEAPHQNGTWSYVVERVEDGMGNVVRYDTENMKIVPNSLFQNITVHNRPRISFDSCDPERPRRVAKEDDKFSMPLRTTGLGNIPASDWPLKVKYSFVPDQMDQAAIPEEHSFEMTGEKSGPRISKAGKYVLESIESQFCRGEIDEPSACPIFNPPFPDVSIQYENIYDNCAGNPIGMLVNLDFVGTPPFTVHYEVRRSGKKYPRAQQFDGLRGQLRFAESVADSYTYQFLNLGDAVYGSVDLKPKNLVLEQDIKPPASAAFVNNRDLKACLGDSVPLEVNFIGEGPWILEYEIVRSGRRKKSTIKSEERSTNIQLPAQSQGGTYSVILTGVQDRSKCRMPLKDERTIEIRSEQPRAGFGDIDGRRHVAALEGKPVRIPLKLQGIGPWIVKVRNNDQQKELTQKFGDKNSFLPVDLRGTYEIFSVEDDCPGVVDVTANTFVVSWIERPSLSMRDPSLEEERATQFRKPAVCQGDESVFTVALSGSPPFNLKYQQRSKPNNGSPAVSNKQLTLSGSTALINMDTSKAGEYTYKFTELRDDRYAPDSRSFGELTVTQKVYTPPTAKFANPGKTYGYCKEEALESTSEEPEAENIPIILTGEPPFSIEVAVNHHGQGPRPELVRLKDIKTKSYNWPLSRASLSLGTHTISIRSVKDSLGCESVLDTDPSSVRITVSSPPTIIPLESTMDYCIGDRVSFSLSGQAPFQVTYTFQNRERKATVSTNEFRRIAESSTLR